MLLESAKALLSGRRPGSLVKALINVSKVTECLLKTSMQRTQTPPTWRTTAFYKSATRGSSCPDVKRQHHWCKAIKRKTLSAFRWVLEVSRFSCWSVSCLCIFWDLLGMISVKLNLSFGLSGKEYMSNSLDHFGEPSNIRITPPKLWATQSHNNQTVRLKGPGPS